MAEIIVGITKFFLVIINKATQVVKTINRIANSESASTPAGKIIILHNNEAKVAYATHLKHLKVSEVDLTFSEVKAPSNLEIYVATDVTINADMIKLLLIF